MGCDIHPYVERKVNGKWIAVDKWEKNEDYEDEYEPKVHVPYGKDIIPHFRNYDTFAILADVRNGYGFAGCKTGEGFEPISEPRGLPDDISQEIKDYADYYGYGDGHSHSWLTLKEILDYDWHGKKTVKTGVVDKQEYINFKKNGKPDEWCGGVAGPGVVHLSNEQMDRLIEEDIASGNAGLKEGGNIAGDMVATLQGGKVEKSYYTTVEWGTTYAEAASWFLENVIPKLKEIDPNPENVRMVFWFDN